MNKETFWLFWNSIFYEFNRRLDYRPCCHTGGGRMRQAAVLLEQGVKPEMHEEV